MNTTTTMNPYAKPTSTAFRAFEMAKKGTTVAAITTLCTKEKIGPARIIREIKLENFRGFKWSVKLTDAGSLKVTNVKGSLKIPVAKKVKPSKKAKTTHKHKAAKKVVKLPAVTVKDDVAAKLVASLNAAKKAKAN